MPSVRESLFSTRVRWTGAYVPGQTGAASYTRDMLVEPDGKPAIGGSASARYLGDASRYNPEDLMLASIAECHLLSYLALATKAGIVLRSLHVELHGTIGRGEDGKTRFTKATLVAHTAVVSDLDVERARALHADAHEHCFMANSVNFAIEVQADISVEPRSSRSSIGP